MPPELTAPCSFSDTHHHSQACGGRATAALWTLVPIAPRPGIQLPKRHPTTSHLRSCLIVRPPNCLPSAYSPPRGDMNGVLSSSKPFRSSQELEDKTQVPHHGLKGSLGPSPVSGVPGSPLRKSQLWQCRGLGTFAHAAGPPSLRMPHSASSFQAHSEPEVRYLPVSSSRTHFTPQPLVPAPW